AADPAPVGARPPQGRPGDHRDQPHHAGRSPPQRRRVRDQQALQGHRPDRACAPRGAGGWPGPCPGADTRRCRRGGQPDDHAGMQGPDPVRDERHPVPLAGRGAPGGPRADFAEPHRPVWRAQQAGHGHCRA
ncbi:hypothetical protein CSC81_18945, partial [Tenacibaculum discolor]